jgi:NifU-like protein
MNPTCSAEQCLTCSDRLVCRCLRVTEEQIVHAIHTGDVQTMRDIRDYTGAGDGCTCCHQEIRGILERFSLQMVEVG